MSTDLKRRISAAKRAANYGDAQRALAALERDADRARAAIDELNARMAAMPNPEPDVRAARALALEAQASAKTLQDAAADAQRQAVANAVAAGIKPQQIAEWMGVTAAFPFQLLREHRERMAGAR